MKEKIIVLIPITIATLIIKGFWLSVLVCGVTFIDISYGVYLVYKSKEEVFNWMRFIEGFVKMIVYSFVIGLSFMASELIFGGKLFEIEHLTPKVFTMLFLTLEATSIDKKRVRLGNKPLLEVIRSMIKVIKEFYKNFTELSSIKENTKQ